MLEDAAVGTPPPPAAAVKRIKGAHEKVNCQDVKPLPLTLSR
jgi:hypothetical protein